MKYLNKEVLDRHMNGDESAVFGATFFGASLSGRYRASKIKLKDIVHRNVSGVITTSDAPQLEASSEEGNENEEANVEKTTTKNVTVVVRGSKIHLKVCQPRERSSSILENLLLLHYRAFHFGVALCRI